MEPVPHPSAAPMKIVGRYAVYDEIASGGMATVHVGRLMGPVGFARTVAIKRLYPQLARDPEFAAMFLDEARVAARVRHPNVVPTLDVVAEGGELFLVMEYVHGESMSQLVRAANAKGRRIPMRIVFAIVSGILQGLHAAHEATNEHGERLGIVHRDVSPQNVLVGVDGVPRLLDFGVAKAVGRLHSTQGGQLKGKLGYMAPEQIRGAMVSPRTDVFSVGVVLWEGLTGRRLFHGDSAGEVLQQALDAPIVAPSKLAPDVPPEIDALVLRALERDADRRFETARAMAVALGTVCHPATQIEVGEWVEDVARERLLKRAKRVADVESMSTVVDGLQLQPGPEAAGAAARSAPPAPPGPPISSPGRPAAPEPPPFAVALLAAPPPSPPQAPAPAEPAAPIPTPAPAAPTEGAPASQVSSVNLSTIEPRFERPPPSPMTLAITAGVSVAAVLLAAGLIWRVTRHDAPSPPDSAAVVAATATASPAAAPEPREASTAEATAAVAPAPEDPASMAPPAAPPPTAEATRPKAHAAEGGDTPRPPAAPRTVAAPTPKPAKPAPTSAPKPPARPSSSSLYSPD